MSVDDRALSGMNPRAFADSSKDLSSAVSRLATEYHQYKTRVVKPLKARRSWSGGGQPDAAAVTEVNGLAIDTMRLRLAAGAVAYVYAYVGFRLAQQQLAAVCRRIEHDSLTIDADGNVKTDTIPVGDDNGPGSTSAKVQAYQRELGKILRFATTIDANAARTLNTSHEPPVTALTNRPGLLEEAKQDHENATIDAMSISNTLEALPRTAAQQLPTESGDLPVPSVGVPPGATETTAIGALLLAAGLGAIEAGAGGGLALAGVTGGGSVGAGAAVAAGGAVVAVVGGVLVIVGGTSLTETTISHTTGRPGEPPKDLEGLLQQAKKADSQTKPEYGDAPDLRVSNHQFGKKIRKHAHDYGLDPADASARAWLRQHIDEIGTTPDEVRRGRWRGVDGYVFYRKGDDVVVAEEDGDFLTILKDGVGNGSFNRATVIG